MPGSWVLSLKTLTSGVLVASRVGNHSIGAPAGNGTRSSICGQPEGEHLKHRLDTGKPSSMSVGLDSLVEIIGDAGCRH